MSEHRLRPGARQGKAGEMNDRVYELVAWLSAILIISTWLVVIT